MSRHAPLSPRTHARYALWMWAVLAVILAGLSWLAAQRSGVDSVSFLFRSLATVLAVALAVASLARMRRAPRDESL
jgi:hypothetical protein